MKVNSEQREEIRNRFFTLRNKEDLIELINDANVLIDEKASSIKLSTLNYYTNPFLSFKRYKVFQIKKKSGSKRTIHAPVKGLKKILRVLNFIFQCVIEPHSAATGFVLGKSVVDNALVHTNQEYVYNIDLKDFFHSFDRNRVKMGIWYHLFQLKKDREKLAFLLSSLVTHPLEIEGEIKIALPQGSPCSPIITNLLCKQLDRRLAGLAKRFGARFTRYADDITFSASRNVFVNKEFQNELYRIIEEDQSLKINPTKTRLQKDGYRKQVTGLTVNEKVNVHRAYIKDIRKWLYLWERYGLGKAQQKFNLDYKRNKASNKKETPSIINVLDGKLEYLKMVKGYDNPAYLKLKKRYDKLETKNHPITEVLDIWEQEGIERAMEAFNKLQLSETRNKKSSSKRININELF